MLPFSPPSPQCDLSCAPSQPRPKQQVNGYSGAGHCRSLSNPLDAGPLHDKPEGRKRQLSLSDEVQRLILTGSPASLYEPYAAAVPGRHALKTAMQNLVNDTLNPADFVILANHFGYHDPLCHFPVSTLQPSDWQAVKETVCEEIAWDQGSDLLPPEVTTYSIYHGDYIEFGNSMFSDVPDRLKESFFTKLIGYFPKVILDLPADERTFEQILAASAHFEILDKLSERERTAELVAEIFQRTGYGLAYIPEAQRSYENCLKACETDGKALEHVPERLKDQQLCRAALSTCGLAYRWLPEELSKKHEWQLLACQQNGAVLELIAQELHDNALREAACCSHGEALRFIEPALITYEMCRLACINSAALAHPYIPGHHLDEELRWLICSTTESRRLYERFRLDTVEFDERLLQENPNVSLRWIPEQSRTADNCLLACQRRWSDLNLVPEQHRTPEVYLAACRHDGFALRWVPEQHRSAEICLAACRSCGSALEWVPEQHHTKEICEAACKQSVYAYEHVAKGVIGLDCFVETMMHHHRRPRSFLTHARRLLSDTDFQSLLNRAVSCSDSLKLMMLSHPEVSCTQKKELIEWMLEPYHNPAP